MTEQEMRDTVKQCGWSYLRRLRKGHWYAYAARKDEGKRREVYIGAISKLAGFSPEGLKQKLSGT